MGRFPSVRYCDSFLAGEVDRMGRAQRPAPTTGDIDAPEARVGAGTAEGATAMCVGLVDVDPGESIKMGVQCFKKSGAAGLVISRGWG